MKLIAESSKENKILEGLSALLNDLGVETETYEQEEAIALAVLSLSDVNSMPAEIYYLSEVELQTFLYETEDHLRAIMTAAGYKALRQMLGIVAVGTSHPDRHLSQNI